MEKVGALGLSDSLMCSTTIVDSKYDAFLFVFRWVTIYWVLDPLVGLMSQHSAPCEEWIRWLFSSPPQARLHRGILSLGDTALPQGWFYLYTCYKWNLGDQLTCREADHAWERLFYCHICAGCDTYSLEAFSTLRFRGLSHSSSMFL